MQHKRRKHLGKALLIVPALALVGGIAVLMTMDVPVQQQPVEQVLDAKAFLGSQPAQ